MTTVSEAKILASRLRARLGQSNVEVTHAQALELVAGQLGYRDWNTASARLATEDPASSPVVVPILRTFPGTEARRFYVDYLGFEVDWEHRFEDGLPLYQQVSRGPCVLHLSEHHGDATPGAGVRIAVSDVEKLQARLRTNDAYPLRPGLQHQAWGVDLTVPDPFGNQLTFHSVPENSAVPRMPA